VQLEQVQLMLGHLLGDVLVVRCAEDGRWVLACAGVVAAWVLMVGVVGVDSVREAAVL